MSIGEDDDKHEKEEEKEEEKEVSCSTLPCGGAEKGPKKNTSTNKCNAARCCAASQMKCRLEKKDKKNMAKKKKTACATQTKVHKKDNQAETELSSLAASA